MLKRACLALWFLLLVVAFCTPAGATTTYYFDMDSDQNHPGTFYTQTGYTSVEVDTLYTPTLKYGWITSPAGTPTPDGQRDRGAILGDPLSNLLRDFHFDSVDRTFKTGLGSGTYTVTLYFRDNTNSHDYIQVFAEGNLSASVDTLTANTTVTRSFTTVVTDGALDLTFHNDTTRGTNPHWVIDGIKINYVPLPSTLLLLSSGVVGLLALRRRRKHV